MYLFWSITGSLNRQSRDGLPGYFALSTDPSPSTSFFSISKSWWPGLSLKIKHITKVTNILYQEL